MQTHYPQIEKRSALLDKISALLAKTQKRGCTEAESLAAAEVAARLMAKHGLSLAELEAIPSPSDACDSDGTPIGNQRAHVVVHVGDAIAYYTDTRMWYQLHGLIHGKHPRLHQHRGAILVFFGLNADVQVALYLTQALRIAMDTEWRAYWNANHKHAKVASSTARASFMRGMARRLSERLCAMKNAQGQKVSGKSRALVVVKERIVNEAYAEFRLGRNFKNRSGQTSSAADSAAMGAGERAADRTTIARGAIEAL